MFRQGKDGLLVQFLGNFITPGALENMLGPSEILLHFFLCEARDLGVIFYATSFGDHAQPLKKVGIQHMWGTWWRE